MKAVKVIAPNELQIEDCEIPALTDSHSGLVKVRAAGLCGSDVGIYRGTSAVATYPRIIGHEFAGEVIEIGSDVTAVSIGDHVSINPVVSCGICHACKKGRANVCADLEVMGVHRDGGFSEYIAVSEKNAFKISKDIPWPQAAIIEPYTVAAQVTSRGDVKAGDTVLILGCGPIGLTILQVSKMIGATCIMSDIIENRLEAARKLGADVVINSNEEDVQSRVMEITNGSGVDAAIDAACIGVTFEQAVLCTGSAGVVVSMGFSNKPSHICELNITKNELDIRGSRLNNGKFPQVIEWIETGKIDSSKIITDTFHFTDVMKAIHKSKSQPENVLKIIFTFDE